MADITEALEQDAIASTLCEPLHSAYEQESEPEYAESESDYSQADGQDSAESLQEASEEQSDPEVQELADDPLAASEEEREQYAQQTAAWDALPAEQQGQMAASFVEQEYLNAHASITPAEAKQFTNEIGRNWGIEDLSERINPTAFAAFGEAWSTHAERTIALHPAGQEFLEAVESDPGRAFQLAAEMCTPAMAQLFLQDFGDVTGQDLSGRNPIQIAAECIVDLAKLQGWGIRQQRQEAEPVGQRSASPRFRTNQDIFGDYVNGGLL